MIPLVLRFTIIYYLLYIECTFQRDSSRRIVNLDEMLPVFHDTFMSRKEDGNNRFFIFIFPRDVIAYYNERTFTVRWSIQEWMHDNDGSPCKLVKAIATATALVTPHGTIS